MSKAGVKRPSIEHSLLQTATLCLVGFGVVMVFSASSTTALLGEAGDATLYLKRTLMIGAFGLGLMYLLARHGLEAVRHATPLILAVAVVLLFATIAIGSSANGAQRWIALGPVQIQASEIAKFALILYGADVLARRPTMLRRFAHLVPYLGVSAFVCALVLAQPDLGTALVIALAVGALLVAAGAPLRWLAALGVGVLGVAAIATALEPYRMARVTGFLDPSADPGGAGFQTIQATIAMGSGGIFGTGLGESVQKAFYLPESHTDMIAAVVGEEAGLLGLGALMALFMMLGYAGLRIAQGAPDRYTKLLAAGLTSLLMVQASINLFAVLGLAPLTGVPLPFVSYGNSSLIVSLASVGLLLNIGAGGRARAASTATGGAARLRLLEGGGSARDRSARSTTRRASDRTRRSASGAKRRQGGNSGRGNGRSRGAGAGRRRRASG